ncbi:hypothetical protein ACVIGB_001994 [Bradyrhizobium sp. USDA 4341]
MRSRAVISAANPGRGAAARRHGADQRHRDRAGRIDRVGIGQAFLAIDHDAKLVAGAKIVSLARRLGLGIGHGHRRGRGKCRLPIRHRIEGRVAGNRRRPAHAARQRERSNQTNEGSAQIAHVRNPATISASINGTHG